MRLWKRDFMLLAVLALCSFCGGGAEGGSEIGNAGNPTTRNVTGVIESQADAGSLSVPLAFLGTVCVADTVIATDSQAETSTADIDSDCAFEIRLAVNKAYVLSFLLDDTFVATLIVTNEADGLSSSVFYVSEGNDAIDLGQISIRNQSAHPEHQPSGQNDQDGDGVLDDEDDDDDNDGTPDTREQDCDLDGFPDDHDHDSDCNDVGDQDDPDGTGAVLEVYPHNSDGDTTTRVSVHERIAVRFDCDVDEATVLSSTFRVVDEHGAAFSCDYELSESGTLVECVHEQHLTANTAYTATISGVTCHNGQEIEPVSWSWQTGENEDE